MNIFFDIIEKYGWMGVIGLLVCMLVFIGLKYLGNRLSGEMSTGLEKVGEKLTDQISKQNDKLIDCMSDQQKDLIKFLINKETSNVQNHNNMLTDRMALAEDINIKLKDIMNIHHAQRAFIIEFHNSSQNLSGIPFAKYSCNYEWFEKGLTPLGHICVSMPFSTIAKIVQDVLVSPNQQVVYTDMDLFEDENPSLYSLLGDARITSLVYSGLHDKNNQLIGLLVLEYHNDVKSNLVNLHQLDVQSAELTSILNIRYKYSK